MTVLALPGVASAAAPIGEVTQFSLPFPSAQPEGITAVADGKVWFSKIVGAGRVGTHTGWSILEWNIPAGVQNPMDIVAGPDGNSQG